MSDSFSAILRGRRIDIPYRSHGATRVWSWASQSTLCLGTRNHDGYFREKCLSMILARKTIDYDSLPYILKLAEEYVLEIVALVADGLPLVPDAMWREFLRENPLWLDRMECRCVSYWDCYYRRRADTLETILMEKGGYRLVPGNSVGIRFERGDYPGIRAVWYLRRLAGDKACGDMSPKGAGHAIASNP